MIDMARKKYSDMETGKTVLLSQSMDSQMARKKKLTPADLIEIKSRAIESQAIDPNVLLRGESKNQKSRAPVLDSQKMEKLIIDPIIVEQMCSMNRKMAPRDQDDLRESIQQSSEDTGILIEQINKSCDTTEIKNEMLWESEANYEKGTSMKVANYARLASATFINSNAGDGADFEQYTRNSKTNAQRRGHLTNTLYNFDAVDYDTSYGKEVNTVKQVGAMGTKYVRNFMDWENVENKLGDITVATSR
jgi:hypothetical protein